MRAGGIGKVVASRCEDVKVGTEVSRPPAYWVGGVLRCVALDGWVLTQFEVRWCVDLGIFIGPGNAWMARVSLKVVGFFSRG
jgi:hypothetical protein